MKKNPAFQFPKEVLNHISMRSIVAKNLVVLEAQSDKARWNNGWSINGENNYL